MGKIDSAVDNIFTKFSEHQISYNYNEEQTGGSKYPTKSTLIAVHPTDGPVGSLSYYPPKKSNGRLLIDRLEINPDHQRKGYGSQLMDELQRRHPQSSINHGDRTDAGKEWWDSYSRDKKVQNGRTSVDSTSLKFKLKTPTKTPRNPDGTKGLHVLHGIHPEHGPVSKLEFYPRDDHIAIQNLSVPRDHRGNGYAGQTMDALQKKYPGLPIDHGNRTESGQNWWDSYGRGKELQNGRTISQKEGTMEEQLEMMNRETMFIESLEDKSIDNPPTVDSQMNPQEGQQNLSDDPDSDSIQTEGSYLTYKPFLNVFNQ